LHGWLERAAAARPDAPAVVEGERVTTFAELRQQAASLASALIESGVSRGDRIGLVLPKTTEAVVSVFAALFAGAVYVPIHPRWPRERIAATLEDCGARLVIEDAEGAPRIRDCRGAATLTWAEALARPATRPAAEGDPADPAFILFTSGSTGRPKGVVISHRAAGAFVSWSADQFRIGPADRIACPAPLGFDLSTFDIFNMALRGAACVLVPESGVWMPRFLTRFLLDERITCWYSVPSLLTLMLREGGLASRGYPELRLILFAGEVFPGPNLARLQAALPHATCANLYGPTETNVVTWYEAPLSFDPSHPPPIGKPCPYAEVKLDAVSGELLAGGESLMSGYWGRPEETGRAFTILEGKRYYRSGDRASLDSDGNYVFEGRLDRQVKRRGYRIELGEIEAAFARLDAILEVAVVAHGNREYETVITAFVRWRLGEELSLVEAKAHCAKFLPAYMLPDRVVPLTAMPKGSRGKIDYRALAQTAAGEGIDGNQN
jgi:amino acid adenylation domain-containing protein